MPKKDINRASKNSLAKFPPATKYPEKNEPTAPTVKTNAAVLNKCNRLSGKMPLSGGKNAFLNPRSLRCAVDPELPRRARE